MKNDSLKLFSFRVINLEKNQYPNKMERMNRASFDVDICQNPKFIGASLVTIFVFEELVRFACKYKKNPSKLNVALIRTRMGQGRIKNTQIFESIQDLEKRQLIEITNDPTFLFGKPNFCTKHKKIRPNIIKDNSIQYNSIQEKKINTKEKHSLQDHSEIGEATHEGAGANSLDEKKIKVTPCDIAQAYNQILGECVNFKKISEQILLTGKAREKILFSMAYLPKINDWECLFKKVKNTPNLNGMGKLDFTPSIIWLIDFDNISKIRAGTFDARNEETIDEKVDRMMRENFDG